MFEVSVLSIFFVLMLFVNFIENYLEREEMKEKIKTVIAEYDGGKQFSCTTKQIMDCPIVYAGGAIIGCWYKKIKGQVLFEYYSNDDRKHRYALFDANKMSYDDYLKVPEIEEFFMNKIFLI